MFDVIFLLLFASLSSSSAAFFFHTTSQQTVVVCCFFFYFLLLAADIEFSLARTHLIVSRGRKGLKVAQKQQQYSKYTRRKNWRQGKGKSSWDKFIANKTHICECRRRERKSSMKSYFSPLVAAVTMISVDSCTFHIALLLLFTWLYIWTDFTWYWTLCRNGTITGQQ